MGRHQLLATFPGTALGVGALRRAVAKVARQCGMTQIDVDAVQLAASEAASNAVIHAYRERPGELRLEAHVDHDLLHVVIADDGGGLSPRTDSPGLGLGLPIMAQVSERFEIVTGPEGTEIHLSFPCPSVAAA
jgi:serine/threonine-protein kinase RsbW/stage II sporulation protein AB (anti-sigma F factor)